MEPTGRAYRQQGTARRLAPIAGHIPGIDQAEGRGATSSLPQHLRRSDPCEKPGTQERAGLSSRSMLLHCKLAYNSKVDGPANSPSSREEKWQQDQFCSRSRTDTNHRSHQNVRTTGKPEVNCRYQALAHLRAFHSPFTGLMSEIEIYQQRLLAIRWVKDAANTGQTLQPYMNSSFDLNSPPYWRLPLSGI